MNRFLVVCCVLNSQTLPVPPSLGGRLGRPGPGTRCHPGDRQKPKPDQSGTGFTVVTHVNTDGPDTTRSEYEMDRSGKKHKVPSVLPVRRLSHPEPQAVHWAHARPAIEQTNALRERT